MLVGHTSAGAYYKTMYIVAEVVVCDSALVLIMMCYNRLIDSCVDINELGNHMCDRYGETQKSRGTRYFYFFDVLPPILKPPF